MVAPDVRQETDFDGVFASFSREPGIGLIVPPDAQRLCLPALRLRWRSDVFGIDNKDMYRQSASYVDRLLRGAKPGVDLADGPRTRGSISSQRTAGP